MRGNFENKSGKRRKRLKSFGRGSGANGANAGVGEDVTGPKETRTAIEEAPDRREDGARMSTEVRQLDVKLTRTSLRIVEMREHVAIRPLNDDDQTLRVDPDRDLKALLDAGAENHDQGRGLDLSL